MNMKRKLRKPAHLLYPCLDPCLCLDPFLPAVSHLEYRKTTNKHGNIYNHLLTYTQ
jgi:hypothetical protein